MSDNPYSASSDPTSPNPYGAQIGSPVDSGQGYINQLPVLGILTIVQAVLEIFMAAGVGAVGGFLGFMANNPEFQEKMQNENVSSTFLVWLYGGLGIGVLIFALLRLAGGIMILRRRARVFSIVTSTIGLATSMTCYCAPTGIALTIYTLVVLLQPAVIAEYARIQQTR